MRRALMTFCFVCIVAPLGLWLANDTSSEAFPAEWVRLDRNLLNAPHILAVATVDSLTATRVASHSELVSDTDQRAYLRHLVLRITSGAASDEERVVRWVRWLQDHFAHPVKPPLDADGQAIYAPLWLLKTRHAHCGQTNRLVVDGLAAIGIKGRLLQLRNHVAAEAYFADDWHYLDADLLDLGTFVRDSNGDIPSALEIMANPALVDGVPALQEALLYPEHRDATETPPVLTPETALRHVFTPWLDPSNNLLTPYAWIKTATAEQETNAYYGWNYYRAERVD